MKLRNLRYFLTESIKSMIRNRLMSLASIVTVASCTLILCVSFFFVTNVNQVLGGLERGLNIIVFIETEATDSQVNALETQITALEYVVGISFTSSEEAMEMMRQDISPALLEGLDYDILPRSFEVEVNHLDNHPFVTEQILSMPHVYEILQDQDGIEIFVGLNRAVAVIGFLTILFLGAISTVIIINTIKITVSARKNEINIMKYVGATDWFIRWPFLMEGILIGIFGASLALGISYFIYTALKNALTSETNPLVVIFQFEPRDVASVFLLLIPMCISMGVGIGVVGSVTSIRKYLRV